MVSIIHSHTLILMDFTMVLTATALEMVKEKRSVSKIGRNRQLRFGTLMSAPRNATRMTSAMLGLCLTWTRSATSTNTRMFLGQMVK
jgi:hypothetical protein